MRLIDTKISIARIYYPVQVLGPGNRVGIWVTGCRKRCAGCISPELQHYDITKEISVANIIELINRIPHPIDGFTISGGEPFYSPFSIKALVSELININDDILLYTGYTLEELQNMDNDDISATMQMCAAIIDGPYKHELNYNQGIKGSSNQRIIVNRYEERYLYMENAERHLQMIRYGDRVLTLGIPKGDKK